MIFTVKHFAILVHEMAIASAHIEVTVSVEWTDETTKVRREKKAAMTIAAQPSFFTKCFMILQWVLMCFFQNGRSKLKRKFSNGWWEISLGKRVNRLHNYIVVTAAPTAEIPLSLTLFYAGMMRRAHFYFVFSKFNYICIAFDASA